MKSLQILEREIERALDTVNKLKKDKQELLSQVKKLEGALKEVDKLKLENIAWQKDKDMIKSIIEKILRNIESLAKTSEEQDAR